MKRAYYTILSLINYYKFVKSRLSSRFYYQELLDMKKQGNQAPVVMDLGCCTGKKKKREREREREKEEKRSFFFLFFALF